MAFKNDDINSIIDWIADCVLDICLSMERNELTLNTEKTAWEANTIRVSGDLILCLNV